MAPPDVTPAVGSGSIVTILSPPYDYSWRTFYEGTPGYATSFVDRANFTGDCKNIANCAFALGVHFRPISGYVWARFAPMVSYIYFYAATSSFAAAYSSAFLGVYITSVDLNYQDRRIELDSRDTLWDVAKWGNEGTVFDGRQSRSLWSKTVDFPAVRARHYFVWILGGLSTWGAKPTNTGGWSDSEAFISGIVSACALDQSVLGGPPDKVIVER